MGINSSRRDFIKKTSMSALGISMLGSIPNYSKSLINNSVKSKSKVVLVKHSQVIDANGVVNNQLLEEIVETALTKYSSGKNSSDFWKKYFTPNEVIGLKVNTLGLNSISNTSATEHYNAVTNALIKNAGKAKHQEKDFIIWDRNNDDLKAAGFTIQKEESKTKIYGTLESRNFDVNEFYAAEVMAGSISTRVSKILTEKCSSLINIPVLKDHQGAGFTGALKNHYGTIHNPREFHANNCTNPGIPELNALEQIKSKQKLVIADALLGVFNGGPRWSRNSMWQFGGILVSEDPVAIDSVMLKIINEKRKVEGLTEITTAKHIQLSSQLGLGESDLSKIDFVEIALG